MFDEFYKYYCQYIHNGISSINIWFCSTGFYNSFQLSFSKVRPVGTELIYVEQVTDRQTDMKYVIGALPRLNKHTWTCYLLSGIGVDFWGANSNFCLFRERKCLLQIWKPHTHFILIPSSSSTKHICQFLSSFVTCYLRTFVLKQTTLNRTSGCHA